jgi:hypothetical protein
MQWYARSPHIFAIASYKNRTVKDALKDDKWLSALSHVGLLNLAHTIDDVQLDENTCVTI